MLEQTQLQNQNQNPLSFSNLNQLKQNFQSPQITTNNNTKTIESNQEEEAPSKNYKILIDFFNNFSKLSNAFHSSYI